MKYHLLTVAALSALTVPLVAQTAPATPALAPSEIVAAAPASDWVAIDAADLLVMTLAPDARGRERRVVIQLIPAPFSQGWVGNIRTFAAAHWWDGLSINRVQDNYVVQWGDADGEDAAKARALPEGLNIVEQRRYVFTPEGVCILHGCSYDFDVALSNKPSIDPYVLGDGVGFFRGWQIANNNAQVQRRATEIQQMRSQRRRNEASRIESEYWPVHCYGMVGVGRNLSPDTGSGAELYTVIGHAPRHLDRNIALVGRVIEGIEHLSSLPRGTGPLGFYESAEERVPIVSIRLATELPAADQPRFEYLSTESESFARYADARANRRDPFFNVPAGGADICNIPVPVRRVTAG